MPGLRQGEKYRCSSCESEVEVIKTSAPSDSMKLDQTGYGQAALGAEGGLNCCGVPMEKMMP